MVSGSSYADEIILVCPGRKLIDTQTSAFVICTTNNLYNRLLIHLNYQFAFAIASRKQILQFICKELKHRSIISVASYNVAIHYGNCNSVEKI